MTETQKRMAESSCVFLPLKLNKTIMKTEPIWDEKENEYG
jgi:hypothetical protein